MVAIAELVNTVRLDSQSAHLVGTGRMYRMYRMYRLTAVLAEHPGRAHIMDVLCRGFLSNPEVGSGGFFSSDNALTRGRTNSNAGEAFDS